MTRTIYVAQTFAVGTALLCLCSLPSCILAPVNGLVKYLACVIIYPKVPLTWPGIANCIPDLWLLLQTNVFATFTVMYVILWYLWPGRDKVCQMLKPPVSSMQKCRSGWNNLLEHTKVRIYQQGFCAWSDVRWLWHVSGRKSTKNQLLHPRSVGGLFSRSVWRPTSWRGVTKTVYHLHIQVHALIWRVTSYHIRLHLRIWLILLERTLCRFISNKELFTAGPHLDVLKRHKVQFLLMRRLPLRMLSRWWGRASQLELPVWLRTPAYRLFIKLYGCKLDEAVVTDLKQYKNLSQFFRRSLKPHLRPTDKTHCLTSPADGRILHLGRVEDGVVEQVKGVTFSLRYFMGQDCTFMELFKRRRLRQVNNVEDKQTFQFHQLQSNVSLRSDFYMERDTFGDQFRSEEDAADIPTTKVGPEDQAELSKMAPYAEIKRLLEKDSGFPVHSSITRNAITLGGTEDAKDDTYAVEEVIYEQVFAIAENGGPVADGICHDNQIPCLSGRPDADYMLTVMPSNDVGVLVQQEADFAAKLILNPGNVLYQCVVYLAPGDYHRFHSPADWTVYCRRHFPGNLFSVNPNTAKWLQGLFVINERSLYIGRWKYGFFSMTAVGATNVGSINVFFDKELRTNTTESEHHHCTYNEVRFTSRSRRGVSLRRGQLMGEFNLGSTVVLLFEAPPNFTFRNQAGDQILYGQGLTNGLRKTCRNKHKRKWHTGKQSSV